MHKKYLAFVGITSQPFACKLFMIISKIGFISRIFSGQRRLAGRLGNLKGGGPPLADIVRLSQATALLWLEKGRTGMLQRCLSHDSRLRRIAQGTRDAARAHAARAPRGRRAPAGGPGYRARASRSPGRIRRSWQARRRPNLICYWH